MSSHRQHYRVDRSTPKESIEDLYDIYETREDRQIPFLFNLNEMRLALREVVDRNDLKELGVVLSVEGAWGSGKTTFVNLALAQLENENVVVVKYDSLFYGNVSEAASIFLDNIFKEVRKTFGVELRDGDIAKNISPRFEINNGIPSFNIGFTPNGDRTPTELIKDNLAHKLRGIEGKVIIVIDDLDRVSGGDVLHFLRIVRVLRELPNFIVILPIDKKAFEELLSSVNIANPQKYLEKIIDWSISIDPNVPSAKSLFSKKIINSTNTPLNSSSLEELWRMVLLELALHSLDSSELRDVGGNIGLGESDPKMQGYERLAGSQAAGNSSLMRAFINRTNTQYGASYNLVTKVIDSTRSDIVFFRSYTTLYHSQSFVDLLRGRATPNIIPPESLADRDQVMIKSHWWRDVDYIRTLNNSNNEQNYAVSLSTTSYSNEEVENRFNATSTTLWEELRPIIETFYPYAGLRHLAPRSINKIVATLNMDALVPLLQEDLLSDRDHQMSTYVQVRYAIDRILEEG